MTYHNSFTGPVLAWYDAHGRKNLPWQSPRDAYRVWLSEVMLQQTQVKTVIPYFNRFMARFPDVFSLATASVDDVLHLWSGLGYYSRARNLHLTAQHIANKENGIFPQDAERLVSLPGIGQSTAHAILAQAFNLPTAILDSNVKRVLSRYFLVDGTNTNTMKQLWNLAEQCTSQERPADYTQAIMDLGSLCCTPKNPSCSLCPLHNTCQAQQKEMVAAYPTKKNKKTIPIQTRQFLLLHDAHSRIYLEKNPPAGIWGGLWCTPQITMDASPAEYLQKTYQLEILNQQELIKIKHTFSHFKLFIDVIAVEIIMNKKALFELPGKWFFMHETETLGLAKPIQDILRAFILKAHNHKIQRAPVETD